MENKYKAKCIINGKEYERLRLLTGCFTHKIREDRIAEWAKTYGIEKADLAIEVDELRERGYVVEGRYAAAKAQKNKRRDFAAEIAYADLEATS